MMPDNRLSTTPVVRTFSGARALAVTALVDYEDGGVGIQDPAEGLTYQRWRARLISAGNSDSYILLDAPNTPEFVVYAAPEINEISFTFDQNMRPAIAFVQSGIAKLRWFDSVVGEQVITEIGSGILNPRVTMDDKRYAATNGYQTNDIILAYVRAGNLYYRQQSDRFTIERLLYSGAPAGLIKIGFNRGLRLQFMLEP